MLAYETGDGSVKSRVALRLSLNLVCVNVTKVHIPVVTRLVVMPVIYRLAIEALGEVPK
jgi:hypothetical protein